VSSLARRFGWTLWEPFGPLVRGRAALGAGRIDAARRDLGAAGELARAAGATGRERLARLLAAQARLLAAGRVAPGRASLSDRTADPEILAIALENDGLAALRAGRPSRAGEAFEAAVASWERMGSTVWLARALRLASATARAQRRTGAARTLERRSGQVLTRLRTPAADRAAIADAADRAVTLE
jgi:hypothetical protein